MDFDADAWAMQQLQRMGYTPRERLAFIRKWQRYAEDNDFLTDRGLPQSGEVASLFDNHYRAHPSALTRLKKLELLVRRAAGQAQVNRNLRGRCGWQRP